MKRYWYVASPYALYKDGKQAAAEIAATYTAALMANGYAAFSPIVHGHELKKFGALPETHQFWLNMDHVLLNSAYGLIVCTVEGWDKSIGVGWEIGETIRAGKPIVYMHSTSLPEELEDHRVTRI